MEQKTKTTTKKIKTSSNSEKKSDNKLVAVIRISGMVKVPKDIENALYRLKLRRKYVCVIVDLSNHSIKGLLEKVKHYVSYGPISKDMQDKLIKARGKKDSEGKLKTFFRLHPPRKGIKSKLQVNQGGVLGYNKEIDKLIERML